MLLLLLLLLLLLGVHADMRTALGFTRFLGAQGTLPYIMCMLRARACKSICGLRGASREQCACRIPGQLHITKT